MNKSPLARRIKNLEKELSAVDSDLRALSKGRTPRRRAFTDTEAGTEPPAGAEPQRPSRTAGDAAGDHADAQAHEPPAAAAEVVDGEVQEIGRRIHDRRFADYLSTSFHPMRPLRHERRIQRNKAILMVVVAALALFWVLYRFFL